MNPPQIIWTSEMQAAWDNFLRIRDVKSSYGSRPIPCESQRYAEPTIYTSSNGTQHFQSPVAEAIFICLAPPAQVAAFESYAREDMTKWKYRVAKPASRFQNVKVNI